MKGISFLIGAVALFLTSMPSVALELSGQMTQGGLIIGKTESGSQVLLGDKTLTVTIDGAFAFGFGRDAALSQVLRVTLPDGTVEIRKLALKKRKYQIQRINGLPGKKVSPNKKALERIIRESKAIETARAVFSPDPQFLGGFEWPVLGRISGVYGSQRILNGKPRRAHSGVDVAAPEGTVVKAAADGIVRLALEDMFFTGKTIHLDHGLGVGTIYTHLSAILVNQGERVRKGQPIGKIGKTGRATGPHLHWGLTWGNVRLDPALVVGKMPK